MEFTEEGWRGLADHARERGILFLSSPFSIQAVDLLERVGMPLWKIASGETSNAMLLDRILDTRKPVLLSTGMSPVEEIDEAVARVRARNVDVGVFQCTTAYPCPPEKIGLNLIPFYRERFGCWVGLSDHSATIYPGLAGAALGMDMLEVHLALSREMFGPDVIASVTTQELRQLVDGVRFIERMRAHPIDKNAPAQETAPLRKLFTRSLVASADLPAGTVIQSIERDGFPIAARVYMVLEGENLVTSAKSTGIGLSELATVFDNIKPDAVVTVADRYETLATAVAASYMNIPLVHVQGGEVTGSIDEKGRHSVTKLSNLHLVSTKLAGEPVEKVRRGSAGGDRNRWPATVNAAAKS